MKFSASRLVPICFILGVFLLLPDQLSAEIDLSTCAGAWLFDEGSGKTVQDSSGNGNDGEMQGDLAWVEGKFGKALDFNGTSDHVIIPDSDSLDLNELTIAAWIYPRSYPEDARIITKEFGVNDPYSIYSLMLSGNNYTKLEFRPVLDNVRYRIPSDADLPINEWTHVAATFDGNNGIIYINAALEKEEQHTGTMLTNDEPVYIGQSQFWTPRFFDGLMDECTLFNVALDQEQIGEFMDQGLAARLAVMPAGKLSAAWAGIKSR